MQSLAASPNCFASLDNGRKMAEQTSDPATWSNELTWWNHTTVYYFAEQQGNNQPMKKLIQGQAQKKNMKGLRTEVDLASKIKGAAATAMDTEFFNQVCLLGLKPTSMPAVRQQCCHSYCL